MKAASAYLTTHQAYVCGLLCHYLCFRTQYYAI